MDNRKTYLRFLRSYAFLVAVAVALLITSGSIVTTIGAGLAVPDWPLSFGAVNPDGWWQNIPVRAEHGHRLIGATVGLLTLILFAWIMIAKTPRKVRIAAAICVVAVIVQGILGGLRVTERNIGFAMVHACLAQAFFCLVIYLCVALSVGRTERSAAARNRLPAAAFACIFVQLIIGSVMRHTQSGLAIPTFPLVFGGLWPTEWSFPVAIHYLHRVWAGVVLVFVIITLASMQRHRCHGSAMTAAWLMAVLTVVQLTLGAAVILGHRAVIPTCAHVIVGALLLACSFCCMLWARLAQAEPSGNLSTANL